MPTIDRRIERLEAVFPARCPTCKTLLHCTVCNDWKQEARAYGLDPDDLVNRLSAILIEQLAGGGTADVEKTH